MNRLPCLFSIVMAFLSWVMVMGYDSFFLSQISLLRKYKVGHSALLFLFFFPVISLVFKTPKFIIHHVKMFGKLQKCKKKKEKKINHEVLTIFIIKYRLRPEKTPV